MESVLKFPTKKSTDGSSKNLLDRLEHSSSPQRTRILTDSIRALLVEFLELDSLDDVTDQQSFVELGADSMQAVDFKILLEKQLQCALRSTVTFDYPRLDLLVEYLLSEVLQFKDPELKAIDIPNQAANEPKLRNESIAIIAMAGLFPGAENAELLWQKIVSGTLLTVTSPNESGGMYYGQVEIGVCPNLELLGIRQDAFSGMDRQLQLVVKTVAEAVKDYQLDFKQLTQTKTGVFIGAREVAFDAQLAYQIPLANRVSFLLNLKGTSETVNSFCTSVHVALNRAMQCLSAGECDQALVGGVNVIAGVEFEQAAAHGLFDDILSKNNCTASFGNNAKGYVRSEGAGVVVLKPLAIAERDGNKILAVIKSSAIYHGGRGYSYEAPNPQALKETIKTCLEKAQISADSVDYIEAHGIGNLMADALELNAINHCYRQSSQHPEKQWHISCIKPSIGHPETASGIASLIKILQALAHEVLPGVPGITELNSELPSIHALLLASENRPWPKSFTPRCAALNSFAIGGMNAHIVIEEYLPGASDQAKQIIGLNKASIKLEQHDLPVLNSVITELFRSVFNIELAQIDLSLSLVDYGFDSIKVIQFITQLNETLGLNIKISQVLGVDNFAGFFELLKQSQLDQRLSEPNSEQLDSPFNAKACPLSEVQKGLWYVNELAPESIAFNVPLTFKIAGKINHEFLQQSLRAMLAEYPILRAAMVQSKDSDEIIQKIRPLDECLIFQSIQLANDKDLENTLWALLKQPFKLATDPLVRLYVIEGDAIGNYVFFVIHHIVFDGTSGALFIASLWAKYSALMTGKAILSRAPELAFFDFVAWERDYLSSTAGEDQSWWRECLADRPTSLILPYDRLPQASLSTQGIGCQKYTLDDASLASLKQVAARNKTNLSVVFLAVFQIFLSKLTQEQEVTVTTPVLGRPKQAFAQSIGCYINVMVVPGSVRSDHRFNELLHISQRQFFEGLDHANYPFPRILSDLGLNLANPAENPFPVSYTYQNFFDALLTNAADMQGVETVFDVFQQSEDHYTLEIYDFRQSLQINFKYKRSLFDDATIAKHLGYFQNLLACVIVNPDQTVRAMALMSVDEQARLVKDFNATEVAYPRNVCIHDLFIQQAERTPAHPAVIFEEQSLSYWQLHQDSDQLARYLQTQGVQPDNIVAVCLQRSPAMLIALLGILKAGGAYLPMDANTPSERISTLLHDSQTRILITQESLIHRLSEATQSLDGTLLAIDSDWPSIAQAQAELHRDVKPEHLAYVIYTSGSTGQPKGVMVEHRNVVNHNLAVIDAYQLTPQDRVLQFSTISFDIFVEEVFPTLLSGGTVILMDGTRYTDLDYFKATLKNQRVSLVNLPTAFWHTLVDENFSDTGLRRVIIGGEKAECQKYQHWHTNNPGIPVINTYGPTETTVISLLYPIPPELDPVRPIPLGSPLANTQIYLLDPDLNPVPIGVLGELHIAGRGVARGYLNQPALTAEKFIANPFGEGKLYKTGDMVKWSNDGRLEYIGRSDDQVKIRGFRVELGEIERALLNDPSIRNAVVVAQAQPQGKRLVAYYQADMDFLEAELSTHLRKLLPDYMQPSAWVKLAELPLNGNGKVNRRLLQEQQVAHTGNHAYVEPRNGVERALVDIWQDVLGITKIGIQDNFFALGGHSLLAIQIVLRTNKQLSVNISLSTLFDAADIEQLAMIVSGAEQTEPEQSLSEYLKQSKEFIF